MNIYNALYARGTFHNSTTGLAHKKQVDDLREKVCSSVIPAADVRHERLTLHRKYFHVVQGVDRMGFDLAAQCARTNHPQESVAEG